MFKDNTIICISTIDWDFLWQRHQIFMRRFSESNNRVFYLENINPNPEINMSLISKAFKRTVRVLSGSKIKEKKIPENLTVITPFIIPFKNRISCFLNENIFFKILLLYLRLKGVNNPIVWTYISTSSALKLIKDLNPSLLVYDCVFDASLHHGSPKDIAISEKKLISAADLIFTDNRYLFKKCKDLNANTHLVPPGVDFESFQHHKAGSNAGLLDDIKKPRICFFGGIDEIRLDLELIAFIAKKRPGWSIVLLGPIIKTDVSPLKLENIFIKGPVEHSRLTGYLAEMDTLILPYKIMPFSKSIFPAKIFECLATGKPVVSTPLEELSFLNNGPIKMASSKEDFLKNIDEALISDTEEAKKERLKIARDNSWSVRLEILENALQETMAKKQKRTS
jgi:glycosyltransferase involved in cell wall biosynthesis